MSRRGKRQTNSPARPSPASQGTSQQSAVTVQKHEFSGPVPHPSILQGYEEILPGAAERILTMAEEDARHQQEMNRAALEAAKAENARGQHYAAALAATILFITGMAVYFGQPWVAGVLGGGTLVGLVGAFLKARGE